jgi:vacuolar-type H+-ATPase subunit F/Vma7
MGRAAVIGEQARTAGFALAGAVVLTAESPDEARAAWRSLPADVSVLVLTARAASWLGEAPATPSVQGGLPPPVPPGPSPATRPDMLLVVMPP